MYKKQRTEIVTISAAAIGKWEVGPSLWRKDTVGFQKGDIAPRA